jgi:hypothetical protein
MGCCGRKTVQVNTPRKVARVIKPFGAKGIGAKACPKCKYPMSRIAKQDKYSKKLVTEWLCMRRECKYRENI